MAKKKQPTRHYLAIFNDPADLDEYAYDLWELELKDSKLYLDGEEYYFFNPCNFLVQDVEPWVMFWLDWNNEYTPTTEEMNSQDFLLFWLMAEVARLPDGLLCEDEID